MNTLQKIPVTILTGFLGSGKTTLLNRILSEEHGKRIAVIENEYGEVGIDHGLVINAEEEIFEMSNGCICCTVRGDLIRVLENLTKRRDKFDYVLVETTGLADPGPVAQTFFMDDEIHEAYSLDGIITLIDAAHIEQQLDRGDESTEQVAFADVMVLNKTDLIDAENLDRIQVRLQEMNRMAKIIRTEHGNVPISTVLNLDAFDLNQVLERRPSFLEPEYPFEWTGVYALSAGHYELSLDDGPDPTMSLVIKYDHGIEDSDLNEGAEWCVRKYAESAKLCSPGEELPIGIHSTLVLETPGRKTFLLDLKESTNVALYAQHTAIEFSLQLMNSQGEIISPSLERTWVAQHEHNDEVGSIAIEKDGDVDINKLNTWLSKLLREKGVDIFRLKGFISIADDPRRFVFQGVHMLLDSQPDRLWGDSQRRNQLVFIGRNLDNTTIRREFEECMI
ncbi:MAG: cobalamin biosynthesis protein CobW [Coxiellaceae bacterium]|nr:cobalamin biosynthesis protein CobW [Coxiellaceae bacterium]